MTSNFRKQEKPARQNAKQKQQEREAEFKDPMRSRNHRKDKNNIEHNQKQKNRTF